MEVQGNWENLTLNVGAIQDSVQSVHFEVERKALPLIIPAKPIQTAESSNNVIPTFSPREVIANNRETTKKVKLHFEE